MPLIVTSGTSRNVDAYRRPYESKLPDNMKADNILGIGIASNDYCYCWYDDQTVSSGKTANLSEYRPREGFSLALGKDASDVVAVSIDGFFDNCIAWYDDNTYSVGTSQELAKHSSGNAYSLPDGITHAQLIDIAISRRIWTFPPRPVPGPSESARYAWYRDQTTSAGKATTPSLDDLRGRSQFSLPPDRSVDDLIAAAIAHSNDHCYYWWRVPQETIEELDQSGDTIFYDD
jgi:hypothetical protein